MRWRRAVTPRQPGRHSRAARNPAAKDARLRGHDVGAGHLALGCRCAGGPRLRSSRVVPAQAGTSRREEVPASAGTTWEVHTFLAGRRRRRCCGRPVSRVLSRRRPKARHGWPFIWDRGRPRPHAVHPGSVPETAPGPGCDPGPSLPLSDLAPGGACRAAPVAGGAVGSYPTVSPLPAPLPRPRRTVLCGAFPGVSPAGRYPAPFLRGARTFLAPSRLREGSAAIRPSARHS